METNIDGKVVPVCQAFEYGKYLGHIDIKFTLDNDRYVINQRSDISVSSGSQLGFFLRTKSLNESNFYSRVNQYFWIHQFLKTKKLWPN